MNGTSARMAAVLGVPSRKFGSNRLSDFHVGLSDKVVGGREPAEVGHSLKVPHDDAWLHAGRDETVWSG